MPANRSRTENWRQSLQQIVERNGALELAVRPPMSEGAGTPGPDIVWRVRLLKVSEQEILVAPPAAAGQQVRLPEHTPLIASFVIGQNRWAFRTTVICEAAAPARSAEPFAIALATPANVERCPRRLNERYATTGFNLPEVRCWPILDPSTIAAAESASRANLSRLWTNAPSTLVAETPSTPITPEVGPSVTARLQNISGGGVGLLVTPDAASVLDRHAFIWAELSLPPYIPAPLCVTVRRVHTHLESTHMVYLGCALDFTWSPQSQRFVADLFNRYLSCLHGKVAVTSEAA